MSLLRSLNFFADLLDLTARSFCNLSLQLRHSLAVSPDKSFAKKILRLASQKHQTNHRQKRRIEC